MLGKILTKFFNLLGQVFMWSLVAALAGILYAGGYFYVKSGEPMTVAEAQQRAPGITFRDFWASRVEQWRAHDAQFAEVKGRPGPCEPLGTVFTAWRTVTVVPFVVQFRLAGRDNIDYYNRALARNNNTMTSPDVLYDAPLLDAAWAELELGTWWQFARTPTGTCTTTYPTPADVSANRDAAGALP